MDTEKLSKINELIQRLVIGVTDKWKGRGNITTYEVVQIAREIVEVAEE